MSEYINCNVSDKCLTIFELREENESLKQRIAELEKSQSDKVFGAIGWAYADCCITLDKGGDPRQTDMNDVLSRARIDLELQKYEVTK
jgi:hypothetical protein